MKRDAGQQSTGIRECHGSTSGYDMEARLLLRCSRISAIREGQMTKTVLSASTNRLMDVQRVCKAICSPPPTRKKRPSAKRVQRKLLGHQSSSSLDRKYPKHSFAIFSPLLIYAVLLAFSWGFRYICDVLPKELRQRDPDHSAQIHVISSQEQSRSQMRS